MSFPSGGMSLTEILSRSLRLLLSHFPVLFAATLIIFLPVLALQLGAPTLMRGRLNALPGGAALISYFCRPKFLAPKVRPCFHRDQ